MKLNPNNIHSTDFAQKFWDHTLEKEYSLQLKVLAKLTIHKCRIMKLDPHLSVLKKNLSGWIKDFTLRIKTVKMLEENIKEIL